MSKNIPRTTTFNFTQVETYSIKKMIDDLQVKVKHSEKSQQFDKSCFRYFFQVFTCCF